MNIDVTPTTKVEIGAQGYLGEGNYPAISSADLYNAAMSISPVEYPKMFFVNGEAMYRELQPITTLTTLIRRLHVVAMTT